MIVPARFNGPPDSGNGGYSAGVMAEGEHRDVRLHRPPPLDTPLSRVGDGVFAPDGALIATLAPVTDLDVVVPPVGHDEAVEAATRYPGLRNHPFPSCFVCGTERPDGLRLFAGPIADGTTAAPWTVPDDVDVPMVWAALDCPGGWTIVGEGRPYLLGTIAAVIDHVPAPGDRCVVRGALVGTQDRKAFTHSTLYGPDGAVLARARATWIAIAA